MRNRQRTFAAIVLAAAGFTVAGCGHKQNDATANAANVPASGALPPTAATATAAPVEPAPHHGKLKGALVGAVVGHELGGHAVAGAAAGALIQHERNKP